MPEHFSIAEADHGYIVMILVVEYKTVNTTISHLARSGAKELVG